MPGPRGPESEASAPLGPVNDEEITMKRVFDPGLAIFKHGARAVKHLADKTDQKHGVLILGFGSSMFSEPSSCASSLGASRLGSMSLADRAVFLDRWLHGGTIALSHLSRIAAMLEICVSISKNSV